MHQPQSLATWRGTLRSAAWVLLVYGLGVLLWRHLAVPHFSPLRLGEPALTQPVELWRPGQHGLIFRYGRPTPESLHVIGDSRVQRGIVTEEMRAAGMGPTVAWTRPAAQTLDLLRLVDEQLPGRLVVALSPLGLHNEQAAALMEEPEKPSAARRLDAWTSEWADRLRRRVAEPVLPPAWRFGWFGGFEQDKFFDAFRHSLRPESRERRLEKFHEVESFLGAMRDKGWAITCVRIPTHGPMRAIEDEAFDPQLFVAMGERLGLPFLDYGVVEGETSDGSHLGVGGARRFSRQLAEDLKGLPGMAPSSAP